MTGRFCRIAGFLAIGFVLTGSTGLEPCASAARGDDAQKKTGGEVKKNIGRKAASARRSLDEPFPKGRREKEFRKLLGEDFRVRHTDHFVVFYSADEEVVKDFIHRIEKTFDSVHRFSRRLNIKVDYTADKLPIIFCRNHDEFREIFRAIRGGEPPDEAAGLYLSGRANVSLFYDMSQNPFMREWADKARQLRDEARTEIDAGTRKAKVREAQWYTNRSKVYREEQNRSVVQHEVAHQLLYNFRVHNFESSWANPQWLVEGLATLFEVPPGKHGAGAGVINQRRLGDIRESIAEFTAEDWRRFIGAASPGRQMLSNEGYARSWALAYFLVKRKSRELSRYVELIKRRKTSRPVSAERELADFEKCFGNVDDAFAASVAEFVKRLPYRAEQE
ncbi:MAG: hypothetical protein DCC65_06425 [Planctomycetota bacterium]|nr:MAG: hypothetical protein DCC65_06425 [Planctomycetota bacterium]